MRGARMRCYRGSKLRPIGVGPMATRPKTRFDILSITDNGTSKARITTYLAHGLTDVSLVGVSGTNGYDGHAYAVKTVTATVFDLSAKPYGVDSGGGTWADES